MPWNDNSKPGPWGSPPSQGGPGNSGGRPSGPRRPKPGGGGSGRGGPGPDLEDLGRQASDRLRSFFQEPDGRWRPSAIGAVAAGIAGLWLLSGLYIVQPNQQAVVTTFGAYTRSEGPGLHYHLPAPIERARTWPVTSLRGLDVGGGTDGDLAESLMLTGDENIIDLRFTVQWRIADAARYQFNVLQQEDTVKDVAESAMREVVGQSSLEAILTTGRSDVEQRAEALMRRTLESYGAGVEVVEVQIRSAAPPSEVVDAFRQVASADQEAESSVNEANAYRNRVVNVAKGDAARLTQSALGYREQMVREAEGEASRFNQIYEQYRRSPAATRERLYIETMERVLAGSNKVVVDSKGASAPIILPSELFRPGARQGAAAAAAPQEGQ